MVNLPDDVLSNIFIRLRAKQIAQMRCMSKSWNALLSQSLFINSHLDRSVHNIDKIVLYCPSGFYFDSKSLPPAITAHPVRSPHIRLPNFIKFPANPQFTTGHGRVVGSVNGLICFEHRSDLHSKFIHIWNPSLSALLTLPPQFNDRLGFDFLRFGFDPQTNDYKVVKLTLVCKHGNILSSEWMKGMVYSMRKGYWESITLEVPSHLRYLLDQDSTCVDGLDGRLHWVAKTGFGSSCRHTILAYNLGAETFHEMPFPDSMRDFNVESDHLGVLGGKICVMLNVPGGGCEVWVMDEYGVAESWVKRHVFPNLCFRLYGFALHNDFFFGVYRHGRRALYDPIIGRTKLLNVHGGYDRTLKVVEYVDSLVWVTPAKSQR